MTNTKKNADVPMLYNNIPRRPPTTERPAIAGLAPNELAALPVEDGDEPLEVEVPSESSSRPDLASAVVLQVKVPWMTLPSSSSKPEQSISAVDCMLKPPLMSTSSGRSGLQKG